MLYAIKFIGSYDNEYFKTFYNDLDNEYNFQHYIRLIGTTNDIKDAWVTDNIRKAIKYRRYIKRRANVDFECVIQPFEIMLKKEIVV